MDHTFKYTEWQNSGKTLRGSLTVVKDGISPWVVFLHGFSGQRMGPGYLFVKIARQLANEGISSLRFDFSGSGESDGLFVDMSISTMRSDFISAHNHLQAMYKPSKTLLLGHSFGGMIAALDAVNVNADGLALLSPVANPMGLAHRREELIKNGPNNDGFYENGPHEMRKTFLDDLQSTNPISALDGYRGPLLLIQGDEDKSISVEESKAYTNWSQHAGNDTAYHVYQGADHNYSRVPFVKRLCNDIAAWAKERFL